MRTVFLMVWFFLITAFPQFTWAGKEQIKNVTAEIVRGTIVVSFELSRGFNKQIEQDIQDGIEKDFYYYVVLNQKEDHWFYEEIAEKTIRYTVKYDTLTKNYTVRRREGGEHREHVFDSQMEMRAFVSRGENIRLAETSILKPDRRYHVWVKAQMKSTHVPRDLERFLFFIPFLELDTPWGKSSSLYAPKHP
jgi:hypothetical protein